MGQTNSKVSTTIIPSITYMIHCLRQKLSIVTRIKHGMSSMTECEPKAKPSAPCTHKTTIAHHTPVTTVAHLYGVKKYNDD